MSREVRRVPVDFDWPLNEIWSGYLMPENLREDKCPDCRNGYSPRAQHLHDLWYGNAAFDPAATGSTPLRFDTPAVRAFAERNLAHAPEYYGTGGAARDREATRLANLAEGRLVDFTHTWTSGSGWQPIDPPVTPTAEQVNEWSLRGFGHDSINASIAVRARCEREGVEVECATCEGHSSIEAYPGQRADAEAWEATEPPTGDGWQLWETTTEGSPMSPVFDDGEELARWMSVNPCGFAKAEISYETALRWVTGSGWAPSMVGGPNGLVDGITFVAGSDVAS